MNEALTLMDWAKTRAGEDRVRSIVPFLAQSNQLLMDMPHMESNCIGKHIVTGQTSLPSIGIEGINRGLHSSKGSFAQFEEKFTDYGSLSDVDEFFLKKLAGAGADEARARYGQLHLEAMGQQVEKDVFYSTRGDDIEKYDGLATRFNSKAGRAGGQVIDGGGTAADNTSIWFICWGVNRVTGIYDRAQGQMGLQRTELGRNQRSTIGPDNRIIYYASEKFQWNIGLAVEDYRCIVRIANLSKATLKGDNAATTLRKFMIQATKKVPMAAKMGKCGFYMNRTAEEALDLERFAAIQRSGGTQADQDSRPTDSYRGFPVRICDSITNNEGRVV